MFATREVVEAQLVGDPGSNPANNNFYFTVNC